MSVDNLSISFASSIGIENIKEEYLARNIVNNLYTDLDQLEKSVDAEFEQYMNQARSFPFHEDTSNNEEQISREHPELRDASVHSDYEILGADLLDQVNDRLDLDDESWQRYLENNDVDEKYNVKPLRNNNSLSSRREDNGEGGEYAEYSRNTSPGEYFGARSLPLNSMDNVWQQQKSLQSQQDEAENHEYSFSSHNSKEEEKVKTATEKLLESRFRTLPRSLGLFPKYELPEIELHHPYTQKRNNNHSISSTRQQCASRENRQQSRKSSSHNTSSHGIRSLSNSSFHYSSSSLPHQQRGFSSNNSNDSEEQQQSDDYCTIEPTSPLHFLCEISPKTIYAKVVHLKITNPSSNSVRSFSLFSSKNLLEFEVNEGMILEHEAVDTKIKIQSSALLSYKRQQLPLDEYPSLYDKILVLIDHQHVTELDVNIDFISLEDDEEEEKEQQQKGSDRPKCRYCALEQGYPLHCLQ